MNRFEESFLNALQDLREKIKSNDLYQMIKASGLLRLLLLDSLIHKANRNHKVKFKFYLTLKNYRKINAKPLNLDEFLSTEWSAYREHSYSIKEIIDSAAHLMGGVHLGNPKEKKEVDIVDMFDYRPITYDPIKRSLKGISELTLETLEELEHKIKNKAAKTVLTIDQE